MKLKAAKPPSPSFPKTLKTLGDHLRRKRIELGLMQKQVADQLGVDTNTITNWERNRTTPELAFMPGLILF
ncbi:MAG TPA: helix-turn-helix transcriptional regulator, partial [Nitrospiria bacterium]|nr:helix-turn-helix transcriptional regulator [Nitrospiria bacterium]